MTLLVLGGGASGKSEYAESKTLRLSEAASCKERYYIATMMAYGESGAYRVKRHRALREGKGFQTIEQPRNIEALIGTLAEHEQATLIIEDLSNLLANEMFAGETDSNEEDLSETNSDEANSECGVVTKIAAGLKAVAEKFANVIFVSNNIFEDGIDYDPSTKEYIANLGAINTEAAKFCDQVTEVVVGIPLELKS